MNHKWKTHTQTNTHTYTNYKINSLENTHTHTHTNTHTYQNTLTSTRTHTHIHDHANPHHTQERSLTTAVPHEHSINTTHNTTDEIYKNREKRQIAKKV